MQSCLLYEAQVAFRLLVVETSPGRRADHYCRAPQAPAPPLACYPHNICRGSRPPGARFAL